MKKLAELRCKIAGLLMLLSALVAVSAVQAQGFSAVNLPNIAVLPFEDTNAYARQEELGEAVSSMFVTAILKSSAQIRVVERIKVKKILEEQGFSLTGATDRLIAVSRLKSIDAIVMGSVSLLKKYHTEGSSRDHLNQIEIDLRVVSTTTAQILFADRIIIDYEGSQYREGNPYDQLRDRVDKLAGQIVDKLVLPYYGQLHVKIPQVDDAAEYLRDIVGYYRPKEFEMTDGTIGETSDKDYIRINLARIAGGLRLKPRHDTYQSVAPQTTPPEPLNLLPGKYLVKLTKKGYRPVEREITIIRDGSATIDIDKFTRELGSIELTGLADSMGVVLRGTSEQTRDFLLRVDIREGNAMLDKKDYAKTEALGKGPDDQAVADIVDASFDASKGSLRLSMLPVGEYLAIVYYKQVTLPRKIVISNFSWSRHIQIGPEVARFSVEKGEKAMGSGEGFFYINHGWVGDNPFSLHIDNRLIGWFKDIDQLVVQDVPVGFHKYEVNVGYQGRLSSASGVFRIEGNGGYAIRFIDREEQYVTQTQAPIKRNYRGQSPMTSY